MAWTSKFCRGGKPRFSLEEDEGYYAPDIWGVGGPQRSVDYAELVEVRGADLEGLRRLGLRLIVFPLSYLRGAIPRCAARRV